MSDDMDMGSKMSGPPPNVPDAPSTGLDVPMLISPPKFQAPSGLANYTPSTRSLHPASSLAPIDDMNVTALGEKEMKALRKALQEKGYIKKKAKPQAPPAKQSTRDPVMEEMMAMDEPELPY